MPTAMQRVRASPSFALAVSMLVPLFSGPDMLPFYARPEESASFIANAARHSVPVVQSAAGWLDHYLQVVGQGGVPPPNTRKPGLDPWLLRAVQWAADARDDPAAAIAGRSNVLAVMQAADAVLSQQNQLLLSTPPRQKVGDIGFSRFSRSGRACGAF